MYSRLRSIYAENAEREMQMRSDETAASPADLTIHSPYPEKIS